MHIQGIGTIFSGGRGVANLERILEKGVNHPAFSECGAAENSQIPVHQVMPEMLKDKAVLKNMRRADRLSKMAVLAAWDAWEDAGLEDLASERIGVICATGLGPHARTFKFLDGILDFGDTAVSPTDFSHSVHNAAAGYITARLQTHGPVQTITDFDFGFQQALRLAECWLTEGRCEAVILGAAEELGEVMLHVCRRMLDLPADGVPKPYGFRDKPCVVPGEGAAFFVMTGRKQSDDSPRYAAIMSSDTGHEDDGRMVKQKPDLEIFDAEGLSGAETSYREKIQGGSLAANYSPLFGSMMTGTAFQCAAAALMIKNRKIYASSHVDGQDPLSLCRTAEPAEVNNVVCRKRGRNGAWQSVKICLEP